jgi:hypothetical protein
VRTSDPRAIADQYEALRREALETGPFGPRGQGLALFLSRGMAAWLAALTALAWPVRATPPEPEQPREEPVHVRPAVRAELTTVLAGMVLACTQPMEVRDA